jgi:DNA-binding response OmpR family regulator
MGLECSVFHSFDSALRHFIKIVSERLCYDLIFVSLALPDESGFHFIKQVRLIERDLINKHFMCALTADDPNSKYIHRL